MSTLRDWKKEPFDWQDLIVFILIVLVLFYAWWYGTLLDVSTVWALLLVGLLAVILRVVKRNRRKSKGSGKR